MGVIDTARLVSRPLDDSDLPFLVEMYADEAVTAGIGGTRDEEQVRARLEGWKHHWEVRGFGGVMFCDRVSGERVGWGGLQHSEIGGVDHITVGYVLRPLSWGKGHATDIAVASIRYAFDVLGLHQVHASVDAGNAASRRVLEKAGMRLHREIDHGTHTEVIYRITR